MRAADGVHSGWFTIVSPANAQLMQSAVCVSSPAIPQVREKCDQRTHICRGGFQTRPPLPGSRGIVQGWVEYRPQEQDRRTPRTKNFHRDTEAQKRAADVVAQLPFSVSLWWKNGRVSNPPLQI